MKPEGISAEKKLLFKKSLCALNLASAGIDAEQRISWTPTDNSRQKRYDADPSDPIIAGSWPENCNAKQNNPHHDAENTIDRANIPCHDFGASSPRH
jgi:hypothetical protein